MSSRSAKPGTHKANNRLDYRLKSAHESLGRALDLASGEVADLVRDAQRAIAKARDKVKASPQPEVEE